MATIQDVIAQRTDYLLGIPGVIGVGQGEDDGKECILVMLTHSSTEAEEAARSALKDMGYPVTFQVIGEIQAQK